MRRLDIAANLLGSGDLTARAPTGGGPPEVHQLADTFNDMAGRLQALVGSHRALVADVSHQLRTPLAAMRLRLELLHDDVDDEAAAELTGALSEIGRLSRLVDGLLAIARAENASPCLTDVDVTQLVTERVEVWSALAAERQITLGVTAPSPAVAASTPGHLEQVLDNLLANALDATPPGGRITVSVQRQHDRIRLEVNDTGPGMTDTQRTQAFRRFWSNAPNRAPADHNGSSGLGLAIVHRLITVDGGHITLGRAPGGGLAAHVDLHAARSHRLSQARAPGGQR